MIRILKSLPRTDCDKSDFDDGHLRFLSENYSHHLCLHPRCASLLRQLLIEVPEDLYCSPYLLVFIVKFVIDKATEHHDSSCKIRKFQLPTHFK